MVYGGEHATNVAKQEVASGRAHQRHWKMRNGKRHPQYPDEVSANEKVRHGITIFYVVYMV